ncbi:ATP-binding protein [Niveispirillum fermenti]
MQDLLPDPLQSLPNNGERAVPTAAVPVLMLLAIAITAIAMILFAAARHFDSGEAERTQQRVRRTLAAYDVALSATTRDYAGWDAAVTHMVDNFNEPWADENVGIYLNGAFRIALSMVVDRQERVVYAVRDGKRLSAERRGELHLPPALGQMVARTIANPPGMTEAVTGLVRMPDGLYLASAADIRPALGGSARPDGLTLLFLQRVDRAAVAHALEPLLLDNLDMPSRLVPGGATGVLALREYGAPDDAPPVGWISWRMPTPAQDFLHGIYWALALVILVLFMLTGLMLLRGQRIVQRERQTQQALSRMLDHCHNLIDSLPDMVCLVREGRVELVNRAGLALFGLMPGQRSQVLGRPFLDLVVPDDRLAFHRRAQSGTQPGRPDWAPLHLAGPGGGAVPVSLIVLSSPGMGAGELTIVARDRGEEMASRENLRAAEARAAIADRAKGQFLANISHELRTPLNAIIGFSEILRDELLGTLGAPQYREYANDIHEGGLHLLRLVNDLLDIARMDAGALELRESWVEIGALIERCERLVREKAVERGVPLRIDVSPPGIRILSDEVRMKQMLVNLMGNAIRFSESGQRIDVRVRLDAITGDMLIEVADQGIGMTVDAMRIALEPFAQVEGGHNRRQPGAGLGLPLARGYAEAHGGSLTMQSTPAVGTTVTVRLPAARVGGTGMRA